MMTKAELWYHGSPLELLRLRKGSTITQNRTLAEIFSHKPTLVSVEDDGRIRHNGVLPGYLYAIDEQVNSEDVIQHPRTSMAPGEEWLTRRPLRLRLLSKIQLSEEERMSEDESAMLLQRLQAAKPIEEAQDGT
jgi:hypothetical protein